MSLGREFGFCGGFGLKLDLFLLLGFHPPIGFRLDRRTLGLAAMSDSPLGFVADRRRTLGRVARGRGMATAQGVSVGCGMGSTAYRF